MQLQKILSPNRTRCRSEAGSKKRVLEQISRVVSETQPELDSNALFASLLNRERLGSTGLGGGIAIPHCRLEGCNGVTGALFTLEEPIDFEAVDEAPVDIIFALVVPEESTQEHLDTLAELARRFSASDYCASLRGADDDADLYQLALAE